MLWSDKFTALGLKDVYDKVLAGERLAFADGVRLFLCPDSVALGALAFHARLRLHGKNTYYVRNRHVNYSNICQINCLFCAYKRKDEQSGGFVLSHEQMLARVCDDGGFPFSEIHVVGGCHPTLRLSWFEELFRKIHQARPQAIIKAFTAMEIAYFSRLENISVTEVLERIHQAGVSMLTGGGAEIFDPEPRRKICPNKISADEYLDIHGQAHMVGLKSNCSILFGHIETLEQRVDHFCRLREQQDKSGGFVCCIPLPYMPLNNELSGAVTQGGRDNGEAPGNQVSEGQTPEDRAVNSGAPDNNASKNKALNNKAPNNKDGREPVAPGADPSLDQGLDRLRTIAVARLMLDNIPHLKAYWVMLGVKLAQAALAFGADDLDGTILEEHIGHMAGAASNQALTRFELEAMIRGSGLVPVRRDPLFRPVFDPAYGDGANQAAISQEKKVEKNRRGGKV